MGTTRGIRSLAIGLMFIFGATACTPGDGGGTTTTTTEAATTTTEATTTTTTTSTTVPPAPQPLAAGCYYIVQWFPPDLLYTGLIDTVDNASYYTSDCVSPWVGGSPKTVVQAPMVQDASGWYLARARCHEIGALSENPRPMSYAPYANSATDELVPPGIFVC